MGRPWTDHESWELIEEASDVSGRDVARLLLDADAEELKDTRNAQLTTYVSSLMVLDAIERLGFLPSFSAGHSLGEYSALTATGGLAFDEGVGLVVERADAMHAAGSEREGTMAAVLGLDDDQVDVACSLVADEVWVANYNAPGQVVIAGTVDGVAAASAQAKELGAKKIMPLQVSGAFHTMLMAGARDRLNVAIEAADLRTTEIPVVANVDANAHEDGGEWGTLLSAQLTSPVRWKQSLQTLSSAGVTDFVELGPGGVLTGMVKRTVDGARTISVQTPDDLDKFIGWMAGESAAPAATAEVGEHLFAHERIVVSPAAGIFTPLDIQPGTVIEVGTVLGHVADQEVRSPFSGALQSFIALDTERVASRQPIAWLRTSA